MDAAPYIPEQYKLSGRVGRAPLVAVLFGVPAALCGGWLYALVCYAVDHGRAQFWVSLAGPPIFGLGIYFLLSKARCRSPFFAFLAGALIGAAANYFHWAAYLYFKQVAMSTGALGGFFQWARDPHELLKGISTLASASGAGGIGEGAWTCEAAWTILCTAFVPWVVLKTEVYCESCGVWCKETKGIAFTEVPGDDALMGKLRTGRIEALLELKSLPKEPPVSHVRVSQALCPSCQNFGTYDLELKKIKKDEKGRESTSAEDLAMEMLLSPATAPVLGQLIARTQSAVAEAPPAPTAPSS